jgi:hypothetical protein
LDEAGVANVNEYLGLLNDAIKDVAEQASTARMARNLLQMGQTPDQIAALLPRVDRAALDGIARRLAAEVVLLEGKSPEEAARETGLTALQTTVVERVLAARGDAAIGYSDTEIAARHDIVASIADLQIDLAEAALPRIWGHLEGGGELSLAAREALIPVAALEQLRHEIPVRGALWSGAAPEDLAARGGAVGAGRIAALAHEIETERAMAARSGLKGAALMIALRLPSEVVAEPAV